MAVETTVVQPEEAGLLSSLAPEEATPGYDALPDSGDDSADDLSGIDSAGELEESTQADDAAGPEIPDELAQLAAQYDLDPETFGGAENLQRAVSRLQAAEDRRLLELAQQWQQSQRDYPSQGQMPYGQQPAYGQQPQGQAGQPSAPGGFQPLDIDKLLPADQFDDGVRSAFKSLNDHYGQQFAPMQQFVQQAVPAFQQMWDRLQQAERFVQEQSQARVHQEIDDYFGSLEPEWESVFGKGPTHDLPPKSVHYQNRMRLLEQGNLLGHAEASMGRAFTPIKQLLGRARGAAFSQQIASIQRKKLVQQAKGRNGAALARPMSKTGKPATGPARAVAVSREFDKKFVLTD